MTTICVTAHVGSDRRLVLDLPEEISPGTHRVTVTLEPEPKPLRARSTVLAEEPGIRREGNLLVFTGELLDQSDDILQRSREDRLDHLSGLSGFCTDAAP